MEESGNRVGKLFRIWPFFPLAPALLVFLLGSIGDLELGASLAALYISWTRVDIQLLVWGLVGVGYVLSSGDRSGVGPRIALYLNVAVVAISGFVVIFVDLPPARFH